jgi:hypothetical protein
MGVATATAISLGLAAVGTGMSVAQGIQGSKAEAKANEAAATAAQDAKRLAELDKFAALNVPTLGLELATQNMQAWQQSQIQALKESGAAGVLGGLTNVNQQAQAQNQQLAAQADQMQYQRDLAQAQNAQQIESDRIARQAGLINAQLGGAQTAASEARQNKQQGQLGAIQGLSSAAQLYAYQDIYGNKNVKQQAPGSNATTLVDIQRTAQDAFKPQISAMRPQNVQMNNPALNQMQANNLSSIPGSGVQALTPMDLMSAPNSPYNWMYGNVTTGQ